MKALFVEGRYDSLVTKLSNKLLNIVKDSYSCVESENGMFAGKKTFFAKGESVPNIEEHPEIYFEEIEAPAIPLEFYLTLKILWIEGLNDYRYGGDAYNDSSKDPNKADTPPLIEVRFEIDPTEYPQILSEISADLSDALRHEIEHITQSGWNVKQGKYKRSDMARRAKIQTGEIETINYWLLQKEQPAMIQGLYTKAKKQRKPFAEVVNQYLDSWVNNGTISTKQKEIIIKRWRKLLPKLGIRQGL
tara:strand:- start:677 stop:1417 length:741 start_codon:yes stop_codon:yes gene_type:complete